jgi:hypothetical protein
MTKKELLEKLVGFPDDAKIGIYDGEYDEVYELTKVYKSDDTRNDDECNVVLR